VFLTMAAITLIVEKLICAAKFQSTRYSMELLLLECRRNFDREICHAFHT